MREVGTHPEEDITVSPLSQNRPSCTRVIWFGLESLNYARVANHARTTALTSLTVWVLHGAWRVRERACVRVTIRGAIATHGRAHEPGSPWNAGSRRCRRRPETFSRATRLRRSEKSKPEWTRNSRALCRAADDSTRDTLGGNARAHMCALCFMCAPVCVCVRADIVDVASLSLVRYADDFCSARRDAADPWLRGTLRSDR